MLKNAARTHTCGELRDAHIGQSVVLQGWAQAVRDAGGVAFLVLRDCHGTTQVTVDERSPAAARDAIEDVHVEYVIEAHGVVAERSGGKNPKMETGSIEVVATEIRALSKTRPLPFTPDRATDASEDIRLRYRYVDLRRPALQRSLLVRHQAALATRRYLDGEGFLEIETPILTKPRPKAPATTSFPAASTRASSTRCRSRRRSSSRS